MQLKLPLTIIIFLISFSGFGQTDAKQEISNLPQLTKQQMQSDFDYFIKIENQFDKEIVRYKEELRYDINEKPNKLRK